MAAGGPDHGHRGWLCGLRVRAQAHGRRTVRVQDLPIGGRPVVLCWRKRIWRCREPACGVRTWTERVTGITPRAMLTQRARAEACRRVGKDAHAVAAVARDLGVGWATVMRAVADHGTPLIDDPARLQGLRRSGWTRPASSRPPGSRPPGGSLAWWTWRVVGCWMWWPTAPGPRWTAGLVPDRAAGWPGSARSPWTPGAATPARWSPSSARPGWWWTTSTPSGWQHRGGSGPPSCAAGYPRPSRPPPRPAVPDPQAAADGGRAAHQPGRVRLRAGLAVEDPTGQVAAAWQGKEFATRSLCRQRPGRRPGRARPLLPLVGRRRGGRALQAGPYGGGVGGRGPRLPCHWRLLQRPDPSREPAHQKVKRVGHGFRNFASYRLRLLLHCGVRWQTHQTAKLRRRPAPSAASRCQDAARRSRHGWGPSG